MIVYEFSTFRKKEGELFSVHEIEVQECPRTYISKNQRIPKCEIDIISPRYGDVMYRLDPDPKPYIEAMTQKIKASIARYENYIATEKSRLDKWAALAEKVNR